MVYFQINCVEGIQIETRHCSKETRIMVLRKQHEAGQVYYGSSSWLERRQTSHYLQEGKQTRLRQLIQDLISLIPGKVFACIPLNRLSTLTAVFLLETQCGFLANQGFTNMIFSLWQIHEKCIEQNMPLNMIFINFTKVFDPVNWDRIK